MESKIKALENSAKFLNLEYEILFGEKAKNIIEYIYTLYNPINRKNHLSIGLDVSIKLKTDEHEFTFSNEYLSNDPVFIFFEQDEFNENMIFILKKGCKLSILLEQCYGMEYFISNESYDFLISVNWYIIEIIKYSQILRER